MQQFKKHRFKNQFIDVENPRNKFAADLKFKPVILSFAITLLWLFQSCRKLVEIPEPSSTIITTKVFSGDGVARQAMAGVYYYMINYWEPSFGRGGMTLYPGLSADELVLYDFSNSEALAFYDNNLIATNNQLASLLWAHPYSRMYQVNAVIEGLEHSSAVSDSVKKELVAEARFVRAFIGFNLVNLFGNVPYPTSTDWRKNGLLSRLPVSEVYARITSDLLLAQADLPENYSAGTGQRIVPNRWAAKALLARVYLYLRDWKNAEIQSSQVIGSNLFKIAPVLNDVFKPNSAEAIWQLQQDNRGFSFNATGEGLTFIPRNSPIVPFPPFAYLSNFLLAAFDSTDMRRISWVNSKTINGTKYYYPYKYKIGPSQAVPNGNYTEYYMVLRLAEQYLVRAEAKAEQSDFTGAIADINVIRQRAGLAAIPNNLSKDLVMEAIVKERRIELFTEWGHRWMDLKRWHKADTVLSAAKGNNWQTNDQLYPIPHSEILTDPNLTQNPGY